MSWKILKKNKYLEDIKIKYEVKAIPNLEHGNSVNHGAGAKGNGNTRTIDKLHTRLSRLISPFKDIKVL